MMPGPAPYMPEAPMPNPTMFRQNIDSVYCKCTNCHQSVHTKVITVTGAAQWIACIVIILLGFWMCCLCFIPFCIDSLRDGTHICPNCGFTIGRIGMFEN